MNSTTDNKKEKEKEKEKKKTQWNELVQIFFHLWSTADTSKKE